MLLSKNCIFPVNDFEFLVADASGKITTFKLLKEGTSQSDVADNNNGKQIIDFVQDADKNAFFVDSERVQLRHSVNRHQSGIVATGVCPDVRSRGKILKLWGKRNLIYALGSDPNTLMVINHNNGSIVEEVYFSGVKKGRSVIDYAVNQADGSIYALTNTGEICFKSFNESQKDGYFEFNRRAKERFRSVAIDWEKKILVTVGTVTLEKYRHQHINYVYDISDVNGIALKCSSEVWETVEPEFKDSVSHVFVTRSAGQDYVCCFTDTTHSLVVFRLDSGFNELELVSFPHRINEGHLVDVRHHNGIFWTASNHHDIIRITLA